MCVEIRLISEGFQLSFGYNVRKLKHGETIELYPIAIRIPELFSTKEITLKCAFTQEEEGRRKSQSKEDLI